ncbi:MAG: hypothetical protein WC091_02125 [Sulfuricellaceae bacterium]
MSDRISQIADAEARMDRVRSEGEQFKKVIAETNSELDTLTGRLGELQSNQENLLAESKAVREADGDWQSIFSQWLSVGRDIAELERDISLLHSHVDGFNADLDYWCSEWRQANSEKIDLENSEED